jgi:hypothetical protein
MWEESLAAFAHMLKEARVGYNASRAHRCVIRRSYLA